MHNLYANFVKIIDVCKSFSKNLVNGRINCRQHRRGKNRLATEKPVPGSHYALSIVHYFTTLVVLVVPSV